MSRLPATPDHVVFLAMARERETQRQMKTRLTKALTRLSQAHGLEAPMTPAFWLEAWRVIVSDPWASCGNMASAVQAMRGCQAAIQELSKVAEHGRPLDEFREMAQRVIHLSVVPQEEEPTA